MQSKEFLDGFLHAVELLGQEGDYRNADWSEAYKYLKARGKKMKQAPTVYGGLQVRVSPSTPAGTIEFHHADGRVDRLVGLAGTGK